MSFLLYFDFMFVKKGQVVTLFFSSSAFAQLTDFTVTELNWKFVWTIVNGCWIDSIEKLKAKLAVLEVLAINIVMEKLTLPYQKHAEQFVINYFFNFRSWHGAMSLILNKLMGSNPLFYKILKQFLWIA